MNSTNGTFVNNERIVKAKLKDGDLITFGRTSYKFQLVDEDRVRHIATIFKGGKEKTSTENKVSLVDTLIESELRSTQSTTIVLKIKYSDGASETVEFNQRVIYVGRASSFGRFEQDPEVSRKHLMIKVNELGEVFIEDQGSTNGSFLNGKKITGMHLVQPNDEIKVGSSRLHISTRKN
jgi:pSer/pThr/pTyr-binding forkhead associated (FHA) protein